MHVKAYGSGALLVAAIPGWGEDHGCFIPLSGLLPPDYTLEACDPPGYGASAVPPSYDLDGVVTPLAKWLDRQPEWQALIGNCSGAILACEALLLTRARVRRLVMIDPFAFLPPYFRLFLRHDFGRQAYQLTFASQLGRWITNQSLSGKRGATDDIVSSFRVVNHEVTYRYLEYFGRHPGIQRFAGLELPVSIITGGRTFAAVRQSVAMWHELWPQASLHRLESCGHLPLREAAADVARIVFASEADEAKR